MKRFACFVRTAAGFPAAVLLSGALAAGHGLAGEPTVSAPSGAAESVAACHISPDVLDVSRPPGPLLVRIEWGPASARGPEPASPAEAIEPGVYIASVNGVRLPAPSATAEGIGERVAGRGVEDRSGPEGRLGRSNGVPALIVRFDRPSDGNPATPEDGDAGDILAMLMGVADGRSVPVCVAGRAAGSAFECCDLIEVRNHGLRDLPRGLAPEPSP